MALAFAQMPSNAWNINHNRECREMFQRKLPSTIQLVFLLLLLLQLQQSMATDYFVSPRNGDDRALGTSSHPFQTIQHALNVATNNDTVKVFGQSPLRNDTATNNPSAPLLPGPLCVQNLLPGGSFEEDGAHWTLVPSHLADIQTATSHVGEKALRLQTAPTVSSTPTVARHLPAKTYATHQHRVRFWARMVGASTQVASTNDLCGQLSVIFSNASTTTTAPLTHPAAFQTNVAIACRPDRSWQYKEAWIPSYGQDGNITVEVQLMDTTGNYTLLVDDVSVVPFPGDQNVTFWSGTNLHNRCDSRQPLSGIVGHVNGAREENQYCEMHLDSGGWELFAMDGIGDKDQHRATLATSHPDGVGVVSSGKGNLVSLIVHCTTTTTAATASTTPPKMF